MIEGVQQRPHPHGGAVGKQRALGGRDGEHLHLAVTQQQTQRAQVVGSAVGVDDGMETRFARVGVRRGQPDGQQQRENRS